MKGNKLKARGLTMIAIGVILAVMVVHPLQAIMERMSIEPMKDLIEKLISKKKLLAQVKKCGILFSSREQ